jgi:putative ABC transport system substrate-binding protein
MVVALALFAWSSSPDAQQPAKIRRVGILSDESPLVGAKTFEPFAQGLRDLGWIEGQNIAFERRYAAENYKILPGLAAELVRIQPDVISVIGTPAARAAKTATQTIPIVFARISDPIGAGLVPSLARPGGNITGVSIQTRELAAKLLELLTTTVPDAKRVGALWDPNFPPASPQLQEVEGAARSLKLELITEPVRSSDDFAPAVRAMVEQGASAIVVVGAAIFFEHPQQLADLMVKARLPGIFFRREQVEAGGLMSYGTNFPDMYRRAAVYVDKILKGAEPADLPVEQPTKFELVINLKTAKALGLTIPPMLLARADEVIE